MMNSSRDEESVDLISDFVLQKGGKKSSDMNGVVSLKSFRSSQFIPDGGQLSWNNLRGMVEGRGI